MTTIKGMTDVADSKLTMILPNITEATTSYCITITHKFQGASFVGWLYNGLSCNLTLLIFRPETLPVSDK